ncbi:MAG TPA: hypothetical protein VM577_18715 [Anaerovoracaceae bacterium]|nr:hypothetical protein [Anaerovoracaceae bacterium]
MIDAEVDLIHRLITGSAGYNIVLPGFLAIYSDNYDWKVSWTEEENQVVMNFYKHFPEALEAAQFFVEKRHELKLGDEYK